MASDEVKHDYHLVEPSAWPIVGSVGTFLMAVGAIAYFQTLKGAPPLVRRLVRSVDLDLGRAAFSATRSSAGGAMS